MRPRLSLPRASATSARVSLPRRPSLALAACALAFGLASARSAHAAPVGTLRLDTRHVGAPVLINGVVVGFAPLPGPWTLPVGAHTVEVRPQGRAALSGQVEVVAGAEVSLALEPPVAGTKGEPSLVHTVVVHTGPGFSLVSASYVAFGLGLAAGGGAAYFGLQANAAAEDARALDPADPKNTRAAQRALMADAERDALKANVLGGLSGIAVMSGVALLLLATDGPLGGDIAVLPTTDGLGVGGVF